VGSGWGSYAEELSHLVAESLESVTTDLYCNAHDVALLGVFAYEQGDVVKAEDALPQYLRDDVAKKPANPQLFG
jgi:tRNA threonylcarbamoyladenosine biosynthesis protein TsaB